MEYLSIFLLTVSLVLLLSFALYALPRKNKCLPGPKGLPILGHVPFLGTNPPRKLMEWSRTYGPMFQINFGSFRAVVICDIKLLSEAFAMPALSGRPYLNSFSVPTEEKGLVFSQYLENREQRQFVLRALKDFGLIGHTYDVTVQDEVANFVTNLESKEGSPTQVIGLFSLSILNSVWNCVMSSKIPAGDLSQHLFNASARITAVPSVLTQLGVFVPSFGSLFPDLTELNSVMEAYKDLYAFMDERIKHHRETWIRNKPRDFVDAYFDKVEGTSDEKSSFFQGKNFLRSTISDLFIASSDTTSASLEFAMLYLAKYPKVQKKLQVEIDQVVPFLKKPTLQDRVKMPYIDATVSEILRFASVVPLGLFHNATESIAFHGYHIPKDTMIISNLYGINYNPEYWGDPENFRPERFMEEDRMQKRKLIHSFSVGRRICPGERIARDQLFMFISRILQKFDVKFASTIIPSLHGVFGFARHPDPFEVLFSPRK